MSAYIRCPHCWCETLDVDTLSCDCKATEPAEWCERGAQFNKETGELRACIAEFLACMEEEWGADLIPFNLSDENAARANSLVVEARRLLGRTQ